MTDPYRIIEPAARPAPARRSLLRPVLWLLLVISAAANIVAATVDPVVGAGFGVIVLGCATALVVHHYRSRRR